MDSAQVDMRLDRIREKTIISLPDDYTQEQYDEEYSRQTTVEAFKELRLERNNRLKKTDHLMVSDYPYPSDTIRSAWITYRQLLRDLPVKTTPYFDENQQLITDWPTIPIWPANVV